MKEDSKHMSDDPILEEIREIRRRLWIEAGQDVSRYIERVTELCGQVKKEKGQRGKRANKAGNTRRPNR